MMKAASEAQSRMGELKNKLSRIKVEGSAGGGLVKVEVNGQQEVLSCRIDKSLLRPEDREVVEDLVVAAMNDALVKVRDAASAEMSQLAGGLDLGSMKEMLGGLGAGGGS
jgi:DNA-binding YbaB/EbfC family protein